MKLSLALAAILVLVGCAAEDPDPRAGMPRRPVQLTHEQAVAADVFAIREGMAEARYLMRLERQQRRANSGQ